MLMYYFFYSVEKKVPWSETFNIQTRYPGHTSLL